MRKTFYLHSNLFSFLNNLLFIRRFTKNRIIRYLSFYLVISVFNIQSVLGVPGGLGLRLEVINNQLRVIGFTDNSIPQNNIIKKDDIIIRINNIDIKGIRINPLYIRDLLSGEAYADHVTIEWERKNMKDDDYSIFRSNRSAKYYDCIVNEQRTQAYYTNHLISPNDISDLGVFLNKQGNSGIGVTLKMNEGQLLIDQLNEPSTAMGSIFPNDRIIKIDDYAVDDIKLSDSILAGLFGGNEGTICKVEILRLEEYRQIQNLVRRKDCQDFILNIDKKTPLLNDPSKNQTVSIGSPKSGNSTPSKQSNEVVKSTSSNSVNQDTKIKTNQSKGSSSIEDLTPEEKQILADKIVGLLAKNSKNNSTRSRDYGDSQEEPVYVCRHCCLVVVGRHPRNEDDHYYNRIGYSGKCVFYCSKCQVTLHLNKGKAVQPASCCHGGQHKWYEGRR